MKRTIIAALLGLAAVAVYGCNTAQGFGKDVERTGDKIEDATKKK